ncbi:hypothetical protein X777_16301 [Ooceraea biroi]|uniref:Uncharacterized protein n=1 Tax=Ooceraea biroi TaxID=2015173 RepID=A0A026VUK1_OOCBI|nr:hypothetical protein X777_16301 [Ooceraea biroi]
MTLGVYQISTYARPQYRTLLYAVAPVRKRRGKAISRNRQVLRLERASGTVWLSRLDTPAIRGEFLCRPKSWTHDSTVMVHGVIWWFSGGGNWRFDNACYITHEGR